LGTPESLAEIKQSHIRRFWNQALNPEALVICLSGDVRTKQIVDEFEDRLSSLRAKKPFKFPEPILPPQQPVFANQTMEKEQAHLIIGFAGFGNTNPDRHALEVLMAAMSGQGGRLFLEMRDKMNLAYAISGFHTEGVGTGMIGFYIGTRQQNLDIATSTLIQQIKKLRNKGITKKELDRAKKYLIGNFDTELAGNRSMAAQAALSELYGLGYMSHKKYPKQIEAVTQKSILKIAKKYLDLDHRVEATIRA
jgi:zinc protease